MRRRDFIAGAGASVLAKPALALTAAQREVLFGGSRYLPQAQALFAAMTTPPTTARKILINNTIGALLSAGIWNQLDVLYVLAAADNQAARLNWINPSTFMALPVNAPTFTTDRGYTGDGSSSRLRTQYTPSVNGMNLTQNNASAWAWVLTDIASSTDDVGSQTAPRILVQSKNTTNSLVGDINSGTAYSTPIGTAIGFSGTQRRASNDRRLWKNGAQASGVDTTASTAVANQEQWICGGNSTSFSTRQISSAAWGASLSGLEAAFYNSILPYMQAVGAA
jgi:hypothetical protein